MVVRRLSCQDCCLPVRQRTRPRNVRSTLAGLRHAPVDWIRRAQIIELSWVHTRVPVFATTLGCSPKIARCWVRRFTVQGLDGLAVRVPKSTSTLVTGSLTASTQSCRRQRLHARHIGSDH